jgi:ABC-type transport system involved in multi-copper enzyme maturation permease subunit
MTWLVWRQHRAEGLILLFVLAVIGVFLLGTGLEIANSFQQLEQSNCLGPNSKGGPCDVLFQALFSQHVYVQFGGLALLALQLLLGALVGAPLVTREVEQHTHLLIWTQSITRQRWLAVKLALALGVGLLVSGALLVALNWWHSPFVQIDGSFGSSVYDTSGSVWVATTLLALALGIFAGALTRRTVAAIFLAIVLFLAIRAPVELLWRPNFETPVTVTYPIDQQNPPALSNQDWIVSRGFIDAQGNRSADFRGSCTSEETATQCLQANGVQANYVTYQPGSRFGTFQWIETGIYVAFSALALVATAWLVRRRLV